MHAIANAYFTALKGAIALLLLVMVVLVFGNVVLRYGFNTGIAPAEEIARWCFVWLVFLGAILGMRDGSHLGVDMLVRAMPPLGRKICFVLSNGLMLYASVLLTQGSWQQTMINLRVSAPSSGLSLGLFYGVGVIFGLSTLAILLSQMWALATGRLTNEDLVSVRESEEVPSDAQTHREGPPSADPAIAKLDPRPLSDGR